MKRPLANESPAVKRDPKNFNISLAELSHAARMEIRRLRTRLSGSLAQAVRFALDQWAREVPLRDRARVARSGSGRKSRIGGAK